MPPRPPRCPPRAPALRPQPSGPVPRVPARRRPVGRPGPVPCEARVQRAAARAEHKAAGRGRRSSCRGRRAGSRGRARRGGLGAAGNFGPAARGLRPGWGGNFHPGHRARRAPGPHEAVPPRGRAGCLRGARTTGPGVPAVPAVAQRPPLRGPHGVCHLSGPHGGRLPGRGPPTPWAELRDGSRSRAGGGRLQVGGRSSPRGKRCRERCQCPGKAASPWRR